ncbi:MAG: RHS repeat-associated core domain-containing protein [Terracidiphilus sp.]
MNEYIYFDGMRIARRDASGNVYYSFGNELGSPTITTATGSICYDADFYPFGGEHAYTSTCAPNQKFAGMEQDSATGLYRTIFRQYAANNGRWLSPDPYAGSYDPTNPQSMNRYAYVGNNPMNYSDPAGLFPTGMELVCQAMSLEGGGWIYTNCVWIETPTTNVTVNGNSDGCSDTNQSACPPQQAGNGPNGPSNGGYGGSGGGSGGAPTAQHSDLWYLYHAYFDQWTAPKETCQKLNAYAADLQNVGLVGSIVGQAGGYLGTATGAVPAVSGNIITKWTAKHCD